MPILAHQVMHTILISDEKKIKRGQCGQARSCIPAGGSPAPVRQASRWIENPGSAEVIPKIKHRAIKTIGRKRKLK